MNTPTDDEIVAHIKATHDLSKPDLKAVRWALELAREGLPVPKKDEASELAKAVVVAWYHRGRTGAWDDLLYTSHRDKALEAARTFLAARDAERDAEVKELVKAAYYALNWLKVIRYEDERTTNLSAALAKMERKP